jgi:methylenetetrahydrofolate dehydrogenase (NADP+)/methenyltetrahydrofolate cyclohydrolase
MFTPAQAGVSTWKIKNHDRTTDRRQRACPQIRAEVAGRTAGAEGRGVQPGLAIVLVGERPGQPGLHPHKVNDSTETGLQATLERYPADLSEAGCWRASASSTPTPRCTASWCNCRCPSTWTASKVIETISPAKDVDGFHVASAGALMTGQPGFWPCTPYGCMKMLESIGYDLRGKHAVVIGRSNIVGKPMA